MQTTEATRGASSSGNDWQRRVLARSVHKNIVAPPWLWSRKLVPRRPAPALSRPLPQAPTHRSGKLKKTRMRPAGSSSSSDSSDTTSGSSASSGSSDSDSDGDFVSKSCKPIFVSRSKRTNIAAQEINENIKLAKFRDRELTLKAQRAQSARSFLDGTNASAVAAAAAMVKEVNDEMPDDTDGLDDAAEYQAYVSAI